MYWLNNIFSSIHIDASSMTSKKMAKYKNNVEFINVYSELVNEALSRYSFKNLPDTVNERVVLESLLWYGSVCFFIKEGQILALPGLPTSAFTLYGDPTKSNIFGRNGYTEEISLFIPNGDDSALVRKTANGETPEEGTGVWIRENKLCFPFINYCIDYADKISDTLRTLDTTRMNIKHPYVVTCEESIVNSVKQFFNKRDNNEEYIISSGIFPADKIKIDPFSNNPEDLRNCTMLVEWYYSQFRMKEGMHTSTSVDKKAQLSVEEFNRDDDVIEAKDDSVVAYLNDQLKFLNEKLGCNISVESNYKEDGENVFTDERNEDI